MLDNHEDNDVRALGFDAGRDEIRHLMALSGSVQWGITSGQLLRPVTARSTARAPRVRRAA